jgi:uncharacterized protein YegL
MDAPDVPTFATGMIARRQLHFIFIVDCSGSMTGDRMASLNYAVRSSIPAMRSTAIDNPEIDVMLRVLAFADGARWVVPEPTPVAGFEWTDLSAGGETDLGAALLELASSLSSDRLPGRQMPPVLVLLSDGLPTDNADAGLAALAGSELGASAVRIAIAIGSDADKTLLQNFIGRSDLVPLQANNAEMLVNQIKWVASVPVRAASSPIGTSSDAVEGLARDVVSQNQDAGDLLW